MTLEHDAIAVLQKELSDWKQYASYCNCCAKSGEHKLYSFEEFIAYRDRYK